MYGPISLSSLPELVSKWMWSDMLPLFFVIGSFLFSLVMQTLFFFTADSPDTVNDDFTMREDFLKECAQWFTVLPRNSEKNTQVFPRKFFNIVDPLKQSNNLGRSVSKGLFLTSRSCVLMVGLDD